MWAEKSILYQIYPLGFCDAPKENDGIVVNRLEKVQGWLDYFEKLGVDTILFNPLFESDRHGYDTRDYTKVDVRLGTNEVLQKLCKELHQRNIKVLFDGVFNHVGRGFFAFIDVLEKRQESAYKDWFYIDFNGNNGYGDGLWYEGWEGHFELVKLNLNNQDVVNHLFSVIKGWVEEFDIDGLRLDVAYCIDREFLKKLRIFCKTLKPDFFLLGEMLFGDYKQIVNPSMLDSATNYECYKGLYSSFNDYNLFEIAHSLNRQYGEEPWTLYKGLHLMNFVDNHDVSRVASILKNPNHVPLIYALMFAMNGIPCIYYGSEWGASGDKAQGDDVVRPSFEQPMENELTKQIQTLITLHKKYEALSYGSHKCLLIQNQQLILQREYQGERVILALNIAEQEATLRADFGDGQLYDLCAGEEIFVGDGLQLSWYSYKFLTNAKKIN